MCVYMHISLSLYIYIYVYTHVIHYIRLFVYLTYPHTAERPERNRSSRRAIKALLRSPRARVQT